MTYFVNDVVEYLGKEYTIVGIATKNGYSLKLKEAVETDDLDVKDISVSFDESKDFKLIL